MALVAEVQDGGAVGLFDHERGDPEVTAAAGRILERDGIAETIRIPQELRGPKV